MLAEDMAIVLRIVGMARSRYECQRSNLRRQPLSSLLALTNLRRQPMSSLLAMTKLRNGPRFRGEKNKGKVVAQNKEVP